MGGTRIWCTVTQTMSASTVAVVTMLPCWHGHRNMLVQLIQFLRQCQLLCRQHQVRCLPLSRLRSLRQHAHLIQIWSMIMNVCGKMGPMASRSQLWRWHTATTSQTMACLGTTGILLREITNVHKQPERPQVVQQHIVFGKTESSVCPSRLVLLQIVIHFPKAALVSSCQA